MIRGLQPNQESTAVTELGGITQDRLEFSIRQQLKDIITEGYRGKTGPAYVL